MRHRFWTTVAILCGLFSAPQFLPAQELTSEQETRILQRFPRADRDGDGKLSPEEIEPIRKQLEKAQQAQKAKMKQAEATPKGPTLKGPVPTHADLQYGDHKHAVMDVWLADSTKPTPIVVAIHGGGFKNGDKSKYHGCAELQACLEKGVSFATINYRFSNEDPRGILACLDDSKRAIQFIRNHASEWNIDKDRVAAYGGSAGAGTTLWLASHDDMADPKNVDPVLRESTRLTVGGLVATQATYDLLQWKDFIPGQEQSASEVKAKEPEILAFYGVQSRDELDSEKGKAIRKERDMLAWMSNDDPPLWMNNAMRGGPVAQGDKGHINHHPAHVERLQKRAEEVGIETVAIAPGIGLQPKAEVSMIDFFFKHLGVQ